MSEREEIRNAYEQGCVDTHAAIQKEPELALTQPEWCEFGEAADDYAASVVRSPPPSVPDQQDLRGKIIARASELADMNEMIHTVPWPSIRFVLLACVKTLSPPPLQAEAGWRDIASAPREIDPRTMLPPEKTGLPHSTGLGQPIFIAVQSLDFPGEDADVIKCCWGLDAFGGGAGWWNLEAEEPLDRDTIGWMPLPPAEFNDGRFETLEQDQRSLPAATPLTALSDGEG